MKKRWVFLITFLSFFLFRAVMQYWTGAFLLSDILPDENWISVNVCQENPGVWESEMEDADLAQVLQLFDQTVVDRGPKFRGMYQPYFELRFQPENGAHTLIYVLEDGRVAVAVEMDTDNYQYFEGGEELYSALQELLPDAS